MMPYTEPSTPPSDDSGYDMNSEIPIPQNARAKKRNMIAIASGKAVSVDLVLHHLGPGAGQTWLSCLAV